MAKRIGVIAALTQEAEAFFPKQGDAGEQGRTLTAAGHTLHIRVCGVGKVNAAIAATQLITGQACDLLLVIGTAGRLRAEQGQCFWISAALQHDYGARRADGFAHYSAGSWPIGPASLLPFTAMADPGTGLLQAVIASGDTFVECPVHSASLAVDLVADLVDMETAAVAQVALQFDIPWAAIKAVSDDANGDSADMFQINLVRAARAAGEGAERFVGLL